MTHRIGWLGLSLSLAACAVGPDYVPPTVEVPSKWHGLSRSEATQIQADYAWWWKSFNDPLLDRLLDEALSANLDLKLAAARIKEARSQWLQTVAAGLPSFSGRSNLSRRRNATSFNQTGSNQGGGFGFGRQIIDIFQLGFDAQWEIDLFGGVRRALEAVDANIEAEQDNLRDVQVSLLAEVARLYVEIRSQQQQKKINREAVASHEATHELAKVRQRAGLGTELEVAQAASLLAATEAQTPLYETAEQQAIHALSVLLGREPAALFDRFAVAAPVPESKAPLPADLPSELLKRRPDVRRAERQLAAANAEIGVATSELYPKINLAAFLGLQNLKVTDFTPIGKSWSMASTLTMPIFNWGKLQANIKAKQAVYEQTFLSYRTTVLTAFKEVEDSLVAYAQQGQRRDALKNNVDASRLAVELANERYLRGLTTFLDVLTAERNVYQAQTELLQSEAETALQRVALYKALGGGWQQHDVANK